MKITDLIIYRLTTTEEQRYRNLALKKQMEYIKYIQESNSSFLRIKK